MRAGAVVALAAVAGGACAAAGPPAPMFEGRPLTSLGGDAFADRAIVPDREQALRAGLVKAKARVGYFFGGLAVAQPRAIFCGTQRCRTHFTGPSHRSAYVPAGMEDPAADSVRPTIVVTRIDETAENVMTHELAHAELRARTGQKWVPAWFNEGLATLIGGDVDCWGRPVDATVDLQSLQQGNVWVERTEDPVVSKATYCAARSEVATWMKTHGRDGLLALVNGVRAGRPFEELYGSVPGGALSRQQINAAIFGKLASVKSCYQRSLAAGHHGDGSVSFGWTIAPDGHVADVTWRDDTLEDHDVARCISVELAKTVFPAARAPTVIHRYPFTFLEGKKPPTP